MGGVPRGLKGKAHRGRIAGFEQGDEVWSIGERGNRRVHGISEPI